MTRFDDEYYIVTADYREPADPTGTKDPEGLFSRFITFQAKDEWTANNDLVFTRNPKQPLVFEAGYQEQRIPLDIPGEIGDLNYGGDLLVRPRIYEALRPLSVIDVQWMHAIYYDIYGQIHEPLHYMKLYEPLDLWDRENSVHARPWDENDPDDKANLTRISLDANKLAAMPFESRLMFRLGVTLTTERVVFHETVVSLLTGMEATGVRFFKVSEYEDLMEMR